MDITALPPPTAAAALRLRYRRDVDELDFRRAVNELALEGHPHSRIAGWLGISQPAVAQLLTTMQGEPAVRPGFSGASPLELCHRFAAGLLSRGALVDELARWEYVLRRDVDPYDDLPMQPPGTFDEVVRAVHSGLIDVEVYADVQSTRSEA